ncbi:MAG: hypothetical protein ACRBK7_00965 [Acidimicrobiales bacterium]
MTATADSTRVAGVESSRRWVARAAWSVAAQALSSVTNFGLTVGLVVALTADEMGRTLSVLSVYLLALTLSRSLVTESVVASADDDRSAGVRSWPWARARILRIAGAAMIGSAAVGLSLNLDPVTLAVLVGALPILLLQDGQRYRAMAADRHRLAASLDGCWLLVSLVLGASAHLLGATWTSAMLIGVWSAGGLVSWSLGLFSGASLPETKHAAGGNPDAGAVANPERRDRYRSLAYSQAVAVIAINLAPLIIAVALSPTMAAATKAVLIPFTAMLSLTAGLRVVTLPTIRRAIDDGRANQLLARLLLALTAATAVVSALTVGAVSLLEPSTLGESFALVEPYLVLGAVLCVLYVLNQQLADAVALSGRADAPVRRMIGIAMEWSGLFIGAGLAGVGGMMAGWTIGLALATGFWLLTWLRR